MDREVKERPEGDGKVRRNDKDEILPRRYKRLRVTSIVLGSPVVDVSHGTLIVWDFYP